MNIYVSNVLVHIDRLEFVYLSFSVLPDSVEIIDGKRLLEDFLQRLNQEPKR